MLNYFPKYFSQKAMQFYFIALAIVSLLFMNRIMNWYWIALGILQVVGFFYFSNKLTQRWSAISEKSFTKKLWQTALILRLVWVVFSYFFYTYMTGQPFEFNTADSYMYHIASNDLATRGFQHIDSALYGLALSDRGYPSYLALVYMLTGKSIFVARIIKAFISAYTVVLLYKLATRNFGEEVGRIAAIFVMLMPNLIYYCGIHLKETEMLFLAVAFMERADYAMRSPKFTIFNLVLPVLLAAVLFFFRTVLGATVLFAFMTALVFSSMKTMKKTGKRIIMIVWVLMTVIYFLGGRIATEVEEVWADRHTNQEISMEWRARREGGNVFAKYASKSIFAPMIVVLPFPTMVGVPNQENQQLIHGGNYVKNIMSFFAMFMLFIMVFEKKWRDHLLIVSFMMGYLLVLAMSAFAHSERFHLPALPFLLILAAAGVSMQTNKTKKIYNWYMIFIFVAIIAWSWIKLAGRGMA